MESFDLWLINENILIQSPFGEETLRVVEPHHIREFNYQSESSWSNFFIAPYQSQRPGYISIGTNPNYIGITKVTPIEAGHGTDIAFLKNLKTILENKKLKSVPYKETGDGFWTNAIKSVSPETNLTDTKDKDFNQSNVPDFQSGATNMQSVTKGIRVSRASGSWSFIIKSESSSYLINNIINYMKEAAKPLIENNRLLFHSSPFNHCL